MSYFRTLFPALLCGTPHSLRATSRETRKCPRALRLEALESRFALSSIATIDGASCLPEAEADTTQQSAVIATAPISASIAETDEFVGPLEADSYYASLESTTPTTPTTIAEGEWVGTPPVLDSLNGSVNGMYWILSGHVTDDQPSSTMVSFGGELAGNSTMVMSDGTFHFYYPMPPGSGGIVTAVAVDTQGNMSNMRSFYM